MEIVRALLRLGIDYIRWTQLVPMLAAWGILVACLLLIAVTSFDGQGTAMLDAVVTVIGAAVGTIVRLLPNSLTGQTDAGTISLSGDDLIAFASWAWIVLSALAMLVNWLFGERLRPPFLATLTGRIKTAGVLAAVISVLLLSIRVAVPENFNGPLVSWLPTMIGGPLIVWIISVYSLSVSAALSFLEAHFDTAVSA